VNELVSTLGGYDVKGKKDVVLQHAGSFEWFP